MGIKELSSIKELFSVCYVLWMRKCQLGKGRRGRKGKALKVMCANTRGSKGILNASV